MATKRRFTQRHKHKKRRYRRDPTRRNHRFSARPPLHPPVKKNNLKINVPLELSNNEYSPVSSPGTSNNNLPPPNSPMTKKAKELAALYPNTRAMLRRATSFNNTGMSNDEFYAMLERELGTSNNWASSS